MSWGMAEVVDLLQAKGLAVEHDAAAGTCTVALADDGAEAPHPTSVSLLAAQEGGRHMLRLDTTYPFRAAEVDEARLATAVLARYLVLGRLEVDDDGSAHHRYSVIVDTHADLPASALDDTVALFDYEQVHFGDYLESVCVRGFPASTLTELVEAGESSESARLD